MSTTIKITRKGQITLPKQIRDFLGSQTVELERIGDAVLMRPVKSVGGSLSRYAKAISDMDAVREKVWEEVARDRGQDRPS